MMKLYLLFFSVLIPFLSSSQNLLVNGSFEEENTCTEYHVECAPEGWISSSSGFSNYIKSPALSYNGDHCMIIEAGRTRNKYQRTYIRTQLLCSLRAGKQYRFECYVKAQTNILDSAGIYFTHYDFLFDKTPLYKITPSCYAIDSHDVTPRDTGWQKLSFVYTAKGDEKFLTVANFSKNDINGETGIPMENHFYIFIDAVSLKAVDPNEKICPDWQRREKEIYDYNDRHEYLDRFIRFYRTQNKMAPSPDLSPTRIIRADTLILPDVLFGVGKYNLQKASFSVLDSFCISAGKHKVDSVVVEGHTDSTGDSNINNILSLQRANTVGEYIRNRSNLSSGQIIIRNWGPLKPVASNRNASGRRKNRRVEILLYVMQ